MPGKYGRQWKRHSQLINKTEELEATNEELTASMEELEATSEELFASMDQMEKSYPIFSTPILPQKKAATALDFQLFIQ
jgi:methyl-accepting chemotaxis protein